MSLKNLSTIILTLSLSSQLLAAPFCDFAYKNRPKSLLKEEMQELKKLNRMDNMTNFVRRYKIKNSESFSYIEKIKNRHNIIDTEVVSWNVDSAIRKWRPLFRKVEGSALYIEKYQKVLEVIEGIPENTITKELLKSKGLSETLQAEVLKAKESIGLKKYSKEILSNVKKETRRLGSQFYEYQYVKGNLERLESLHCNPECLSQLERLKNEIGITSKFERSYFQELVGKRTNLKLSFVEKTFQENIYAFSVAQRIELFHEVGSFLGSYVREVDLFWKLMKSLSEKSWVQKRGLAKLFKGIYDNRAKIVSDPLINQIIRVHSDPATTLAGVKAQIQAQRQADDLLVDFSRREDAMAQKTWNEVKDYAKTHDASFHETMIKADEIADFLGGRSQHIPRGFYYGLAGVTLGGAFVLYSGFDTEAEPAKKPKKEEPKNELPGLNLPLYPDDDEENDTIQKVVLGEKNYKEMLEILENNADSFQTVPPK